MYTVNINLGNKNITVNATIAKIKRPIRKVLCMTIRCLEIKHSSMRFIFLNEHKNYDFDSVDKGYGSSSRRLLLSQIKLSQQEKQRECPCRQVLFQDLTI